MTDVIYPELLVKSLVLLGIVGVPVRELYAPSNASVMPYPAIVVGLPVSDANDCAGTDVIYPLSFVKSLTLEGI